LGIGDWGLGPIPNPQSPIPNPHGPFPYPNKLFIRKSLNLFIYISKFNVLFFKEDKR
jgi:hypothetical protein